MHCLGICQHKIWKGQGLEFPWVGSSQKSCKNSECRPGADTDLKGIDIFYSKYPNRTHPFAWWQHFPCRARSTDAGKDVSKEKTLMRNNFAGSTEYSDKQFAWNSPWAREGCTQQGSEQTAGYQRHSLLSLQYWVIAFGSRASWSEWTS